MSPVSPARRRAETFQRLLDDPSDRDRASTELAELAELASFANRLGEQPQPAPRPEFSADLRARLMAAAGTELAAPTTPEVTRKLTVGGLGDADVRRRHRRRLTAVVGGISIVAGVSGAAVASQGALPGEALYPIKQVLEGAETGLTSDDDARGRALLERAHTRLAEAADLVESGHGSSADLERALTAFAEQAEDGGDRLLTSYDQHGRRATIAELRDFGGAALDRLTALEARVPDAARPALIAAADTVLRLDRSAAQACPDCGGAGISDLPSSLLEQTTALAPIRVPTLDPPPDQTGAQPADPPPAAGSPLPSDRRGEAAAGPTSGYASADAADGSEDPGAGATPDDSGPILTGQDGALTGEKGLLPKQKTGTVGGVVDGVVGGVEGLVGGLLDGLSGDA